MKLKKEILLISVFLSLLILVFFYQIFFLDKTLITNFYYPGTIPSGAYGYNGYKVKSHSVIDVGASAWQEIPLTQLASQIYKNFGIPLWNPYSGSGTPLAANMHPAVFYPFKLLLFIFPTTFFWDLYFLVRIFIAGFFTYLFMRLIGTKKTASVFASVAFAFSGYLILYLNMPHLGIEILVPALLYSIEGLLKTGRRFFQILLIIIVFLGVIGGFPESTLFLFIFGAIYGLARVVNVFGIGKDAIVKTGQLVLSSFIGILLAAPLLLLFLEFLKVARVPIHMPEVKIGLAYAPIEGFITLFSPNFFGRLGQFWYGLSSYRILPYFGILPIILAFIGLKSIKTKKFFVVFFVLYAIVSLLKSYGFPGVNWIGSLPILSLAIFPKYNHPEITFSIVVLAGLGLESIETQIKKIASWRLLLPVFFLSVITLSYQFFYQDLITTSNKWRDVNETVAFTFVILVLTTIVFFLTKKNVLKNWLIPTAFIGILLLELFVYLPKEWSNRYDPFTIPPYVNFLRQDNSQYRVFGLDGILFPNTSSAYQIQDIRILDAMYIERYINLVQKTIDPKIDDRFTGENLIHFETNKFLDLLGVKYIFTTSPMESKNLIYDLLKLGKKEGDESFFSQSYFTIDKKTKVILYEHPPAKLSYNFNVGQKDKFKFAYGIDPQVWSPDKGDGVLFEIMINDGKIEKKLFSSFIDPKNKKEDQKWFYGEIDLSQYKNKDITLVLQTSPGESYLYDWAGWADPEFEGLNQEKQLPFELVYNNEIKIYKNPDALPRTFIAKEANIVKNPDEIIPRLSAPDFNLANSIVLEKDLPEGIPSKFESEEAGVAKITNYQPNKVEIEAETKIGGFLVLTDNYYPGWKAYVDGNQTEIYRTDYTFRSLFLPAGKHQVKFIYDPLSFKLGLIISSLTFLLLLLALTKRTRIDS